MQTIIKEKKSFSIGQFKKALEIKGNIKQIIKDRNGITIKIDETNFMGGVNRELEQRYNQEELNTALNITGEVERLILIKAQIPLFDKVELTYKYEVNQNG